MARAGTEDTAPPKPRQKEVLDTAARIFHTRGYASSSVQVIADELGILKGSVYYYISSKEDLLYQLLKEVHDDLGVILADAQASPSGSPLDRLHTYVRRQTEYGAHNVARIAIYYRDSDQLSPDHLASINSQRKSHEIFVKGLISEGQILGLVPAEEDPRVLANLIFGTFIWTYRWYNPTRELSVNDVGIATADFVIRAVSSGVGSA